MLKNNFYKIFSGLLFQLSLSLYILSGLLFKKNLVIFLEYNFYTLNSSELVMVFLIDWMSIIFISIVLMISSVVVLYSSSYMGGDMNKNRFLILVIFFILSMGLMIISPNMISILLGWDGLGLISYCLVIYYQNVKSYNAGMLTVMSNRIGDIAILLAISWMLNFGSWNFIFYLDYMKSDNLMYVIWVLVIMGGITKSAQIPFSSWLPAAMAAPTPVSALVHSSTLVTAGVYLLIRFSGLMVDTVLFNFLMVLGMMTMFMAGLAANFEFDLKKIIALSTLSQWGLMMSVLGMGFESLAYFHFLSHAFFKKLLFLFPGVLIHSFKDSQDIRFMGNCLKFMPLIWTSFNISNLSLCGIPFLSGYYSKDLILEFMFMSNMGMITLFLLVFSTGLTVSYTFRLFFYSLFTDHNLMLLFNMEDNNFFMMNSMWPMLILSVVGGSVLLWMLLPEVYLIYLPSILKYLVSCAMFMGSILGGWFMFSYKFKTIKIYYLKSLFLGSMWFMPILSTKNLSLSFLGLGLTGFKVLDLGWSEYLAGKSLSWNISVIFQIGQLFQKNYFKIFLMIFVMWLIILVYMFM
uniref:NADH-ubiquinone oxidoreductase chain 5 n=1 Tax=Phryganopsyche latipennis TaxID=177652 RepID=A0A4Y1JWM2_9NEOP|nr:NADH dehydrogenase subunit 5 [Phryganopsyche latipennis]APQ47897.1 NADH dehydrogenase subunit 5 [Phryganopsyche latipennis]